MDVNQYVSERLREFRVEKRDNRADVADHLSMSISAYGKLEAGKSAIDTNRIYQLSQLFNKRIKEFFPSLHNSDEDSKLAEISLGLEI